jgi:hypothetical protein
MAFGMASPSPTATTKKTVSPTNQHRFTGFTRRTNHLIGGSPAFTIG